LSTEKFTSRTLMEGAIRELESLKPVEQATTDPKATIEKAEVLKVADRFSSPQLGEGLSQLENIDERFKSDNKVVKTLAATELVPELDRIARKLPAAERKTFADTVLEHAATGKTQRLSELIVAKNKEVN